MQAAQTTRTEDRAGHTLGIVSLLESEGEIRRDEAVIGADAAVIRHVTTVETREVTVSLPPGVRFDDGDGLLPDWDRKAPLEFDNFNIDAHAVEHVVIAARGTAVLRQTYQGRSIMAAAWLTLDPQGRIAALDQPSFGGSVAVKLSDEAAVRKPHAAFRAISSVMMKAPYRISEGAAAGHIRYHFGVLRGIDFAPPQTPEQRVTADADGVTVDICAGCGPGLPSDPAFLAEALKPTLWLQSDAPMIRAIAEPIAQKHTTETHKMELLLEAARPYLGRVDFNGFYSALEAMHRKAGDCGEAAAMLAALGRAAGIPTKIVDGLVYSRYAYHGVKDTFMPHAWVLAYVDGQWKSFDLALDTFDATHIALTIGDGDERRAAAAIELAGLLRWDSMVEIRARPAP